MFRFFLNILFYLLFLHLSFFSIMLSFLRLSIKHKVTSVTSTDMTFFSTADYREHYLQQLSSRDSFLAVRKFVQIHPLLFVECVSVVVMTVLALVVHCLMLLVYYFLKIICLWVTELKEEGAGRRK